MKHISVPMKFVIPIPQVKFNKVKVANMSAKRETKFWLQSDKWSYPRRVLEADNMCLHSWTDRLANDYDNNNVDMIDIKV